MFFIFYSCNKIFSRFLAVSYWSCMSCRICFYLNCFSFDWRRASLVYRSLPSSRSTVSTPPDSGNYWRMLCSSLFCLPSESSESSSFSPIFFSSVPSGSAGGFDSSSGLSISSLELSSLTSFIVDYSSLVTVPFLLFSMNFLAGIKSVYLPS